MSLVAFWRPASRSWVADRLTGVTERVHQRALREWSSYCAAAPASARVLRRRAFMPLHWCLAVGRLVRPYRVELRWVERTGFESMGFGSRHRRTVKRVCPECGETW